jgi:pyruvate ferredoxin oxidoreductase gamma subunit
VTAAKILRSRGHHEGAYAQAIPAYGHERRGAPVYADAMISSDPIKQGFRLCPRLCGDFRYSVMDKGIDVMAGTTPQTVFIVNTPDLNILSFLTISFWVDAQTIALKTLSRYPNTAMLGALAGARLVGIKPYVRPPINSRRRRTCLNAAQAAFDGIVSMENKGGTSVSKPMRIQRRSRPSSIHAPWSLRA